MSNTTAVAVLLVLGSVAYAGPTARFGLTGAAVDSGAPGQVQIGPMVAVGERSGPFVGELEWAYLSFFDSDATPGGVNRLGVTLRADLTRSVKPHCRYLGCTRGRSFYAEAGADEKFGQWLDASRPIPAPSPQPEAHVGLGMELDNQIFPNRGGWQFGIRLAVAPHGGAESGVACRGTSCMSTTATGTTAGLGTAVLLEWMFVIGR